MRVLYEYNNKIKMNLKMNLKIHDSLSLRFKLRQGVRTYVDMVILNYPVDISNCVYISPVHVFIWTSTEIIYVHIRM